MTLGPVTVTVEQLKRGIATILIVFLPHTFIIFLFKCSPSLERHDQYAPDYDELHPSLENMESADDFAGKIDFHSEPTIELRTHTS